MRWARGSTLGDSAPTGPPEHSFAQFASLTTTRLGHSADTWKKFEGSFASRKSLRSFPKGRSTWEVFGIGKLDTMTDIRTAVMLQGLQSGRASDEKKVSWDYVLVTRLLLEGNCSKVPETREHLVDFNATAFFLSYVEDVQLARSRQSQV